jgi:hypothetical protein
MYAETGIVPLKHAKSLLGSCREHIQPSAENDPAWAYQVIGRLCQALLER